MREREMCVSRRAETVMTNEGKKEKEMIRNTMVGEGKEILGGERAWE